MAATSGNKLAGDNVPSSLFYLGAQCCLRLEIRLPGGKGRSHFLSVEEGALGEFSGSPRTRYSSREPSTLETPKGALGRWPRGQRVALGERVGKASWEACYSLGFLLYHFSVILNMLDSLCFRNTP